ncbi:hypothetical protein N7467_000699 [Penicillium canescens]|nr:hypothetical protein N7467_000699 [Penicillium canescens]
MAPKAEYSLSKDKKDSTKNPPSRRQGSPCGGHRALPLEDLQNFQYRGTPDPTLLNFVANGRAMGITTSAARSGYYRLREKMIEEADDAAAGEDEVEPTQGDEVEIVLK